MSWGGVTRARRGVVGLFNPAVGLFGAKAREGIIEFCRELIRIPSLPQQEGALAEAIRARMVDLGYDEAWIDDAGNVIGRVGDGGGPAILFDGHLDTVGVTDASQWRHDPFGGEVEDGQIYGRGTSDMKGSVAAMVYAAGSLVPEKSRLRGTVYVCGSVCEELVEGPGLGRAIQKVKPDYVVIGESSSLNLQIGQRGRAEILLETIGKPAHSSTPGLGINAVEKMAFLLPALKKIPMPTDPLLGSAIMELTDIISRPYPGISMVPDQCLATFDRRLMAGETPEGVVRAVEDVIAVLARDDRGLRAKVSIAEARFKTYTGFEISVPKFAPAWKLPEDHFLAGTALGALRGIGLTPSVGAYAFCTNGSYSAGKYGLPTIGFGPANEAQAHTIDEYIKIQNLIRGAGGYRAIARAVCGAA